MTQKTAIEVLTEVGYEGFVKALFNRSGDLPKDFAHAVLGIVTECHEYLTEPTKSTPSKKVATCAST
jgi:hypothetical protein